MKQPFAENYPFLNWWIENQGFIQIGYDDDEPVQAYLRVLDAGGVCWELEDADSVDDALEQAEIYLKTEEIPDRFGEGTVHEIEQKLT